MNIPLSLLIYNPIEAYTMILLCDIITGNRTKINPKLVLYLYVFGAVNLCIQLFPTIWVNEPLFAILNIIVNYLFVPISIKIFYGIVTHKVTYFKCFIVEVINCIFIIVISNIFVLFIESYNMFYTVNKFHEFITNMVIFFVQITLYLIIRFKAGNYYEKYCKSYR